MKVISLLTDFGLKGYYVGAVKGVLTKICPDVKVIDITHNISKWDIREAAYVLSCCYRYFPSGTIHLVIVDPGVGTKRRGIVIKTKRYFFVGPDNGVLVPAALEDGIESIHSIENKELFLEDVSPTFHGRDIFAPVAARLARGINLESIGPRIMNIIFPSFYEPKIDMKNREVICEVIFIDEFGNVATNVKIDTLKRLNIKYGTKLKIKIQDKTLEVKLLPSFGYIDEGKPLALVNSCGRLELAINRGNAAEFLGIKPSDKIIIKVI